MNAWEDDWAAGAVAAEDRERALRKQAKEAAALKYRTDVKFNARVKLALNVMTETTLGGNFAEMALMVVAALDRAEHAAEAAAEDAEFERRRGEAEDREDRF